MVERRRVNRELGEGPPEATGERRIEERRDSHRVPMSFLVREVGSRGSYEEREGDLSLGGIYWKGLTPPKEKFVEVRFRLAGVPKEIKALGEIIQLQRQGGKLGFHVRFTELDVESELGIARYLEQRR